jgi:hypothetical protein
MHEDLEDWVRYLNRRGQVLVEVVIDPYDIRLLRIRKKGSEKIDRQELLALISEEFSAQNFCQRDPSLMEPMMIIRLTTLQQAA